MTAHDRLLADARTLLGHVRDGSVPLAPDVMTLPASHYTDPERFAAERRQLFRRLPLMLAASCELPAPGSYKAMEVAGVPLLLTRDKAGTAHALLNICPHRGALVAQGCGQASRHTCPYHGWTFDAAGKLLGVALPQHFGQVDKPAMGLRPLPVLESAGLIWAILDPDSTLDIRSFLGGFDQMLAGFGFEGWHLLERRSLTGANWKLAFDAHLEFYHLPVLHRNSFGPDISPHAIYHMHGPHQRLTRPVIPRGRTLPDQANLFAMADRPQADWPTEALMLGEWIIYPNVSINSFYDGGRGVIISQVFPGKTVEESVTIQTYLTATAPDDEARAAALRISDFLGHVVADEDLPTSVAQQRALGSGLMPSVCFGRNEAGLQHFHRWTDQILATENKDLATLF
jgi:phenylpropionate dioxygenase-like ring-hydroxylating dioxygenase large terminal subunit